MQPCPGLEGQEGGQSPEAGGAPLSTAGEDFMVPELDTAPVHLQGPQRSRCVWQGWQSESISWSYCLVGHEQILPRLSKFKQMKTVKVEGKTSKHFSDKAKSTWESRCRCGMCGDHQQNHLRRSCYRETEETVWKKK